MSQDQFSRVRLVISSKSLDALQSFKVSVIGLTSTGTEIIKDLLLCNVGSICVHDTSQTTIYDVGSNFYARMSDISSLRVNTILPRLHELNERSSLFSHTDEISDDWLSQSHAIIVTEFLPFRQIAHISEFCHAHGILFIMAVTLGPCFCIFEDFNSNFESKNKDGKDPIHSHVQFISKHLNPRVDILEMPGDQKFKPGMKVLLTDIAGQSQLSGVQTRIVSDPKDPKVLRLDIDTSGMPPFDRSKPLGKITQVKESAFFNHKGINDCAVKSDIQSIVLSILHFFDSKNRLPNLLSADDEESVLEGVELRSFTKEKAKTLIGLSSIEFPPTAVIAGGCAAQESMKFSTHYFVPIEDQWYDGDYSDLILWSSPPHPALDRYDPIRLVIGNDTLDSIRSQSFLVVGVGAVGCEYCRSIALFGPKKVVLFDDDIIELSNLSRQFLFLNRHRGLYKVAVAKEAMLSANPDIQCVEDYHTIFTEETLASLNFESFGICFSGVDNYSARKFLSQLCYIYSVPFVNSGIERLSGDTQIVIPGYTTKYNIIEESADPTATCTLRNHPTNIGHTIQWAHNAFVELFDMAPSAVLTYIKKRKITDDRQIPFAISLLKSVPTNEADCVKWALNQFRLRLEMPISAQLKSHPPGSLDTITGLPYWNSVSKVPTEVKFISSNRTHLEFLRAASELKALMHGIKFECDDTKLMQLAESAIIEESPTERGGTIEEIESLVSGAGNIRQIKYDKDDPLHIQFVRSFANVRGQCFGIEDASEIQTIAISGSVAPTIATTTSVTGSAAFIVVPFAFCKEIRGHIYETQYIYLSPLSLQRVRASEASLRKRYGFNKERKINIWEPIEVDENKTLLELKTEISEGAKTNDIVFDISGHGVDPEEYPDSPIGEHIRKVFPNKRRDKFIVNVVPLPGDNGKVPQIYLPPIIVKLN